MSEQKQAVSPRAHAIWRAAITLAHNMCARESNRIREDDGPMDATLALDEHARNLRQWLEPSDEILRGIFEEASVPADSAQIYVCSERNGDLLAIHTLRTLNAEVEFLVVDDRDVASYATRGLESPAETHARLRQDPDYVMHTPAGGP